MKDENVIEVRNLKKMFKVYYDKGSQLKERMLFWNRNRYEERWVLNGVNFQIKKGEAVALIGSNGCGKSTTLKLLSKIIYPDDGIIEMKGRVSSLIELGAGFHPDMSGRENIYINAAIFGLSKKEIDQRIDQIIEFSELEEFIDNPVRTYSSGMYMRLAFSVAINVDADILLVDEILAVGDAGFQTKCMNKMKEIKAKGTSIILVSHSMVQVEQLCDRTIWIQDGKVIRDGEPRDIDPEYMQFIGQEYVRKNDIIEQTTDDCDEQKNDENNDRGEQALVNQNDDSEHKKRWGNGDAKIIKISMKGEKGGVGSRFITGEKVIIDVEYKVKKNVKNATFGIGIFGYNGMQCYGTNTIIDRVKPFDLTADGKFSIELTQFNFLPGVYTLDVAIQKDVGIPVDYFREAYSFEIYSPIADVGIARIQHLWNI